MDKNFDLLKTHPNVVKGMGLAIILGFCVISVGERNPIYSLIGLVIILSVHAFSYTFFEHKRILLVMLFITISSFILSLALMLGFISNDESRIWWAFVISGTVMGATLVTLAWTLYNTSQDKVKMHQHDEIAQASKISAWSKIDKNGKIFIYLLNKSDMPIYSLAYYYRDKKEVKYNVLHTLRPSNDPEEIYIGRKIIFKKKKNSIDIIAIDFADHMGRYWIRDEDGVLFKNLHFNYTKPTDKAIKDYRESQKKYIYDLIGQEIVLL